MISIIIVNWNAREQLLGCLMSIERYANKSLLNEVIVVDNDSSDDSIALIEKIKFSFRLIIDKVNENLGFARACNRGASQTGDVECLLFLNPDTKFTVEPLEQCVNVFKDNPKVGIVGVQLVDEKDEVMQSCSYFPSVSNHISDICGLPRFFPKYFSGMDMLSFDHKHSCVVDQVMGAYFFIRKSLFDQLKGFDERFFVYFEEVDLSYRAKQIGFDSYFLADVAIFHRGGGTSHQVKDKRLFYSMQSKLLYSAKNFKKTSHVFIIFLMVLLIEPITRAGFCLLQKDKCGFINTLKAYKMLYLSLPMLAHRIRKK